MSQTSAVPRPPLSRRPAVGAMRQDHPLMRSTPRRPGSKDGREARYQPTALVSRRQVERRREAEQRDRRPSMLISLLLIVSAILALTWAGLLVIDRRHPGLIARARENFIASVTSTFQPAPQVSRGPGPGPVR